ncbi:transposase [Marinobacter sp. SS13-12]|uniref:integrase core domain-containing protein n=1 Tax=Marinobacter sp. SS13-12 TaxID=3050451 RepID=UPI00330758CF
MLIRWIAQTEQTYFKTDNASEVAGKVTYRWAHEGKIEIAFLQPGKPTDNATVESFNGRLRQECLNANCLLSLAAAREKVEAWRTPYYHASPLSSLECSTPSDYAREHEVYPRKQQPSEPGFSNSGST